VPPFVQGTKKHDTSRATNTGTDHEPTDTSARPAGRWEDVDRKLSGKKPTDTTDAAIAGAANFGKKRESGVTLP